MLPYQKTTTGGDRRRETRNRIYLGGPKALSIASDNTLNTTL
jgi:hypothetical protein